MEQFTLRYNELTGILRERKEKEQKDRPEEGAVAGTKTGDLSHSKKKMTVLEKQLELWKEEEVEFNKDMEQTQILNLRKNSKAESLVQSVVLVILYMKKVTVEKKKDRKVLI